MESKTKPSKRDAILDAMLDVVVERGFHEAPMSLIGERSNTSAGLSYHFAELRHAGLTRTEKQGTWRLMHLRLEEIEELYPGLLTAVLKGASEEHPGRDDRDAPAGFVDEDESPCSASGPRRQKEPKVS
jgi:AcrR family transcriptional regulator